MKRHVKLDVLWLALWALLQSSMLVADNRDWSAADLWAAIEADEAPILLDVRTAEEFSSGHVPGAVNIPVRQLAARIEELAPYRSTEIVVYCEAGPRARLASLVLSGNDFERVGFLDGHMRAWRQAGLPTSDTIP